MADTFMVFLGLWLVLYDYGFEVEDNYIIVLRVAQFNFVLSIFADLKCHYLAYRLFRRA